MNRKFIKKSRYFYKKRKKFDRKEKVLKGFMRSFCVFDCNSGDRRGVFECEFPDCPLFHYRFDNFSE